MKSEFNLRNFNLIVLNENAINFFFFFKLIKTTKNYYKNSLFIMVIVVLAIYLYEKILAEKK